MPSYSELTEPLLRLTRKWKWDFEVQVAYVWLKSKVTEITTLSIFNPDPTIRTEIRTDASDTGVGAVLLQCDEKGDPRVIAFASRTLTTDERK